MRTPLHTLDALEAEIAKAPKQARTGASFLNLDTRVIEWLIEDSRRVFDFECQVDPGELESLIADKSANRAADAISEKFLVLRKCDCDVVCQDRRDDCRYRFKIPADGASAAATALKALLAKEGYLFVVADTAPDIDVEKLRAALESIADWRKINIAGEYEHGLRDIIRSITDFAAAALDAAPHPASHPAQGAPHRSELVKHLANDPFHRDQFSMAQFRNPAEQDLAPEEDASMSSQRHPTVGEGS